MHKKLGIIAGGGAIPQDLINFCKENKRDYFVIAIEGNADKALIDDSIPHELAVQQLIIVAFFKLPAKCISPVIVRHEGSTRIFFIDRYNLHILPVRLVGCFFGHSACC